VNIAQVRIPRQKALIGAAIGLAATVLAACRTYGNNDDAGRTATESAAPSTGQAGGKAIAKTADVPVGSGIIVDKVVLTQPTAGDFKGFSSTCTHAGCELNKIADGTIDCPCHGSKFNLDGSVAHGPATKPLQTETVTVQGDSIILG
jgi:nitrite reductase/ring-hydroxylating ferredoxin subunit